MPPVGAVSNPNRQKSVSNLTTRERRRVHAELSGAGDRGGGGVSFRPVAGTSEYVMPSGKQHGIGHGDQRAVVVEVGGGLRTYETGGGRCSTVMPSIRSAAAGVGSR